MELHCIWNLIYVIPLQLLCGVEYCVVFYHDIYSDESISNYISGFL